MSHRMSGVRIVPAGDSLSTAQVSTGFLRNYALKRLGVLLPIFSVVLGLGLLVFDPLPMQTLRNNVFDQYQRW